MAQQGSKNIKMFDPAIFKKLNPRGFDADRDAYDAAVKAATNNNYVEGINYDEPKP
jgi:hypothetical protein